MTANLQCKVFAVTLVDLTYLQFNLIAIIDAGKHEGVTFDDVKASLAGGTLISWLQHRFPDECDMSLYRRGLNENGTEVVTALKEAAEGVSGRERKKMGVEHNGICLLAALVTEVIQRREWK